ncbi:MAG TPA: hypothetical protein VMX13_17195 [Sedimentisphaerales bacterium]|nr:hypothetical protein [Sedimentisphaerales bacterium]
MVFGSFWCATRALPPKGEAVGKLILLYSLILGTVIAVMVLIMFLCGWRPDIDQGKRAWKSLSPALLGRIIIPVFYCLCGLALLKMGMSKENATFVVLCLIWLLAGAAWFWSRKKLKNRIKELNNQLTCKPKQKDEQ